MESGFKVGEKLVYPNHGVTVLESINYSPIFGTDTIYYYLRILANNSRLMVPVENVQKYGLRRLCVMKDIKSLLVLLEKPAEKENPRDWSNRYRENLECMKTGKLEDLAKVVKRLFVAQKRKSLSFREKKMYDRAMYLLFSEISLVKDIPERDAERLVELSLQKSFSIKCPKCGGSFERNKEHACETRNEIIREFLS